MHPGRSTVIHYCCDFVTHADPTQGEITRGNRLGKLNQVGLHVPMFQSKHLSRSSKTRDYLICNQQYIVLVAYLPYSRKVIILRYDHTTGTLNRFRQKHRDGIRPFFQYLLLEFVSRCNPLAFRSSRRIVTIRVRGRDMTESWHPRLKHLPVRRDARCAHRGERHTMISPYSRYHLSFFGLSPDFPVIPSELNIAIGRLSATGRQVKMIDIWIRKVRQAFGKFNRSRIGTANVS